MPVLGNHGVINWPFNLKRPPAWNVEYRSRRGPLGSAKLSRRLLKSFFEKGDQPQAQFATLIDSMANLIEDRELLGLRNFPLKTRHDTMKNSIGNIR